MPSDLTDGFEVDPDWYAMDEQPRYQFDLDRREFFRAMGGGIVVLLLAESADAGAQEGRRGGFGGGRTSGPQEISAWLHIGEDGAVTVLTGKVELGQNARTSLTQVAAEELHAPASAIRVTMGDTSLVPWDAGTFGSLTTPQMVPQIRRAAAAAREMLLDLAAERWNVDRADVTVADGLVKEHASGRAAGFGELTRGQKLVKAIGADVRLTPSEEWKVAGKAIRKVGDRAFVTGAPHYTGDIKRPGMLYGKVVRPTAFNASLVSVDTRRAGDMAGVTVVHDGDFIGVAAATTHQARKAADAVKAEWKAETQPSDKELFDYLRKQAGERGTAFSLVDPAMQQVMAGADKTLKQTYTIAYIAHTPLEPRTAVAEWNADGSLTAWVATRGPFSVRSELARAFRLPEDRVRVLVPDVGGGYGGKCQGEAAIEAARLARAAGKPVKVAWTREEEFTWGYVRPAGVIDVTSAAKADGTLVAWTHRNINSGPQGLEPPYTVVNQRTEFVGTRSPLRQGSYRALASTANHFARETHIDEMAAALRMEPLAFRLKNLKNERVRAVLNAAAGRFGWDSKPAAGRGYGIACGADKGGNTATCAEIAVDPRTRRVSVRRIVTAFECGAVISPDLLKNQIEGCAVMGIGGALFEAIRFENGKITNPYLSMYRVPRLADAPIIEAVVVNRKDITPAGAGEIPMVGVAPAIGNAIFQATGIRLRSMPLAPSGLPKVSA